jgi:hypothetical protein
MSRTIAICACAGFFEAKLNNTLVISSFPTGLVPVAGRFGNQKLCRSFVTNPLSTGTPPVGLIMAKVIQRLKN